MWLHKHSIKLPPFQEMEAHPLKVAIPFGPLLLKITEHLKFPEPTYRFLEKPANNAVVFVRTEPDKLSSVYVGGRSANIAVSCERAAEVAVLDLIRRYQVTVEDITALKTQALQKRATLNILKRLQQEVEGGGMAAVWESMKQNNLETKPSTTIVIDYVDSMRCILHQINLPSGLISTVESAPGCFTAWLTLPRSSYLANPECIFSDECGGEVEAHENLAKKVILFLIPIYRLEVVDANYDRLGKNYDDLIRKMTTEQYLALRELLVPFNGEGKYDVVDFGGGCVTPKEAAHQIPNSTEPPLPPKKRTAREYLAGSSAVPETKPTAHTFFPAPADLANVFGQPSKPV